MENKKVLVIEDDLMLASIITRQLAKEHIVSALLNSGEKALENIKDFKPDVIILDIFLPVVNGLDLLEAIRKDDTIKHIKVLVVSNTDQKNDRERAKNMGAGFYLKAAVTPKEIVDEVKRMLG